MAIVNTNVAAASSMIMWITPGAGYVQPGYAILMVLIGGFTGTLLTGLFCRIDVNHNGKNGAFYGNPIQLGHQLLGIVITILYSATCTAVILIPMHFIIGIRTNRVEQVRGLDNIVHGVLDLE